MELRIQSAATPPPSLRGNDSSGEEGASLFDEMLRAASSSAASPPPPQSPPNAPPQSLSPNNSPEDRGSTSANRDADAPLENLDRGGDHTQQYSPKPEQEVSTTPTKLDAESLKQLTAQHEGLEQVSEPDPHPRQLEPVPSKTPRTNPVKKEITVLQTDTEEGQAHATEQDDSSSVDPGDLLGLSAPPWATVPTRSMVVPQERPAAVPEKIEKELAFASDEISPLISDQPQPGSATVPSILNSIEPGQEVLAISPVQRHGQAIPTPNSLQWSPPTSRVQVRTPGGANGAAAAGTQAAAAQPPAAIAQTTPAPFQPVNVPAGPASTQNGPANPPVPKLVVKLNTAFLPGARILAQSSTVVPSPIVAAQLTNSQQRPLAAAGASSSTRDRAAPRVSARRGSVAAAGVVAKGVASKAPDKDGLVVNKRVANSPEAGANTTVASPESVNGAATEKSDLPLSSDLKSHVDLASSAQVQESETALASRSALQSIEPAAPSATDHAGARTVSGEGLSRIDGTTTSNGSQARSDLAGDGQGVGLRVVDRVRLVQRVSKALQVAMERGNPLRVRLSPPELGTLRLEITLKNGVMRAKAETETQSARELLLDNIRSLQDRLAQQNIKLEHFDVELMDRQGGRADTFPREQQGDADQSRRRRKTDGEGIRAVRGNSPTGSGRGQRIDPGGLNVII